MVGEIWASFRRMPVWVQIWVVGVLLPVNLAPLAFLDEPAAVYIAALSVGGMLPNLWIMLHERGVSRAMGIPHVVVWTPLILGLLWGLGNGPTGSDTYRAMLIGLFAVDSLSLGFDYADVWKWWRGDRAIA